MGEWTVVVLHWLAATFISFTGIHKWLLKTWCNTTILSLLSYRITGDFYALLPYAWWNLEQVIECSTKLCSKSFQRDKNSGNDYDWQVYPSDENLPVGYTAKWGILAMTLILTVFSALALSQDPLGSCWSIRSVKGSSHKLKAKYVYQEKTGFSLFVLMPALCRKYEPKQVHPQDRQVFSVSELVSLWLWGFVKHCPWLLCLCLSHKCEHLCTYSWVARVFLELVSNLRCTDFVSEAKFSHSLYTPTYTKWVTPVFNLV